MNNGTMNPQQMDAMTNSTRNAHQPTRAPQEMRLVRVTPEMASGWLEASAGNFRRLDKSSAEGLANRIAESGWVLDANPFKFNSRGTLVDGQHRAYAIKRLGITVTAWVATGVDDDTTVDTGRTRSLSQILQSRGEKNYDVMASTLSYIYSYRKGLLGTYSRDRYAGNRELLKLLEATPEIRRSVEYGARARKLAVGGHMGMLHFVASEAGLQNAADAFCDAVTNGADITDGDPVLFLRKRLIADRGATKNKLINKEKLALTIKAWNAWLAGQSVGTLRWRGTGPTAEPFPIISLTGEVG